MKLGLGFMDWIRCEGLLPNAMSFLCRYNFPGARAFLRWKLDRAIDVHLAYAELVIGQPMVRPAREGLEVEIAKVAQ